MRTSWNLALAAGAVFFCVTMTSAGIVRPGETIVVNPDDLSTPEGRVLAKSVVPFSIEYTAMGEFLEFPGTLDGTLTSTVVREESRGTLTFLYDVDLAAPASGDEPADASDASILTVDGFSGFDTRVGGVLEHESSLIASRTPDGSAVRLSSDDPGLGGAPQLVVRTDATDFAATGTARFFAGDDLAVRTPDGLEIEFAAGTAIVAGTFQPVDLDAPAPNPIPLPPAGWAGLTIFAGAMLKRVISRRVLRPARSTAPSAEA